MKNKCDKCGHETKGYVVAERNNNNIGDWFFIEGIFCLDCARINMHSRAKEGYITAVFRNQFQRLTKDQYLYFIDNRDKSEYRINNSLGGLINSLPSDYL